MKKRSARAPAKRGTSASKVGRKPADRPAGNAAPTPGDQAPGIVGIGASAGGLEAFTRLLGKLPTDSGLAYVLVQHLARGHESFLPELLAKTATIPVAQARDGMRVEPDRAYVIPPNVTMTVADGHLRLAPRPTGRALHLPVDSFLCSLSDVHGAGAIAVILSGAGSDGARGVEAIKEMGGIVFAQDTASAKHPSMPEAAIATGSVDFVLTPEEIADELAQIGRYFRQSGEQPAAPDGDAKDESEVMAVLKLLHRRTGVDFAQYRRGTVRRRILRRMLVHRKEKRSDYLALLRKNPTELDLLYEDLLIGVTAFFRDTEVFEELHETVFPALLRAHRDETPIRVWVAGCSGGEEAYSLAIALTEFLEEVGSDVRIQIFATDLSDVAIARARAGVYPQSITERVSPERISRFFVPDRGQLRIAKFIRDSCVFSRQNIVRDPPFSHMDLISCRNVLIYFESALQRRVFPTFHYALEPHGMLILGTAESPGAASELFAPINRRHKIYRRLDVPRSARTLDFVSYAARGLPAPPSAAPRMPRTPQRHAGTADSAPAEELDAAVDRLLVEHFGRHGVVVEDDLSITAFRGDTTPFLAHSSGSATLDVLRLAKPDLVIPLRRALRQAKTERRAVRESQPSVARGVERLVTIDVLPIPTAPKRSPRFLVLFDEDVQAAKSPKRKASSSRAKTRGDSGEVLRLRSELASTRTHLSELVEQHEANLEELRAATEEIQSSNEELQSTNEELETTKEEVQSTNEELSTLNDELRHRNRELGELASDLANVFASTTIPIVIVGSDLRLRRFTPATTRVMKVQPSDVGRSLSDIKMAFTLPELETRITTAIQTLAVTRDLVQDDKGGDWALTVRPYQTMDRRVDGAVLVFTDARELAEERRLGAEAAEAARVAAVRSGEKLAESVRQRVRVEDQRTELLRRLESAQEDERRRLSRELHDEVGQHLTALGLGLRALSDLTPAGSEMDRGVESLRAQVDRLGQELHSIALRLRPRALDDFGLEVAIASYAEEWSKQVGITIDVHAPPNGRLPEPTESAVYRVVQEALTNVARHSGAKNASITVDRRDGQLHVIVEDDGQGFESPPGPGSTAAAPGLGLLGMRERIGLVGGTMEIEAKPGRGTTIYLRVPVAEGGASANA